jgi:hypothetical protein
MPLMIDMNLIWDRTWYSKTKDVCSSISFCNVLQPYGCYLATNYCITQKYSTVLTVPLLPGQYSSVQYSNERLVGNFTFPTISFISGRSNLCHSNRCLHTKYTCLRPHSDNTFVPIFSHPKMAQNPLLGKYNTKIK